jgi:hypothetical protein
MTVEDAVDAATEAPNTILERNMKPIGLQLFSEVRRSSGADRGVPVASNSPHSPTQLHSHSRVRSGCRGSGLQDDVLVGVGVR